VKYQTTSSNIKLNRSRINSRKIQITMHQYYSKYTLFIIQTCNRQAPVDQ